MLPEGLELRAWNLHSFCKFLPIIQTGDLEVTQKVHLQK